MHTGILRIAVLACVGVVGLASTAAEAGRSEARLEVVPASTPRTFAIQAEHVRESMRGNGRYARISTADRQQVEADIAKIERLLEEHGSADNLSGHDWTALVNAQEEVNALLTENDGDRLVCRYEKRTGSHFRVKHCNTVDELARRRNEDQEHFHYLNRRPVQQLKGG